MVDHSHQGFDVIKGENFILENKTINEDMFLNVKHI